MHYLYVNAPSEPARSFNQPLRTYVTWRSHKFFDLNEPWWCLAFGTYCRSQVHIRLSIVVWSDLSAQLWAAAMQSAPLCMFSVTAEAYIESRSHFTCTVNQTIYSTLSRNAALNQSINMHIYNVYRSFPSGQIHSRWSYFYDLVTLTYYRLTVQVLDTWRAISWMRPFLQVWR